MNIVIVYINIKLNKKDIFIFIYDMIYEILNMINTFVVIFIFLTGINVLMYWCLRTLSHRMEKQYKWICEFCGEVIKSHTQPYCKPCSHIERQSKKMNKIDD